MTNTMKTLVFIVSLFVFLGLYTVAADLINPHASAMSDAKLLVIFALSLIIAYVAALYSQALVKYLYTKSFIKDANIMMKLPVPPFKVNERLVAYVLPACAVFVPLFKGNAMSVNAVISVASLALLTIIVEIMFYLNSKTMHAYITNKGIAIMGIDTRFEVALPLNYTNLSGFYSFERIDNFLAFPDRVIIYQLFDYSVITILCDAEQSKQIKGLLIANKIPEKKLQGV